MDVHLGIGRAVGGPADHAHLHRRHPAQQLYTPAVPQAYLDILELRSNVWFGELIRNIHLHFHQLVGAIVTLGMAVFGLFLLPFVDLRLDNVGVHFCSGRGRSLSLLAVGLGIALIPARVLLDEFILDWVAWLPGWDPLLSNGLIPLALNRPRSLPARRVDYPLLYFSL